MAAGGRATTGLQISITLVFFVLFLFAGHLGIWFVLFPVDPDARLFGFPVHYALALLASWPVLLVLVAAYARIANRLDDRIGRDEGSTGETKQPVDA